MFDYMTMFLLSFLLQGAQKHEKPSIARWQINLNMSVTRLLLTSDEIGAKYCTCRPSKSGASSSRTTYKQCFRVKDGREQMPLEHSPRFCSWSCIQ